MSLRIGQLAQATGTTAPTIRYYEAIGLLPSPPRAGGQRRYGEDDVRRLTFIRRCRDFGFPIEQVRILAALTCDSECSCAEARDLGVAHLAAVREKIRELRILEHHIARLIEAAEASCCSGSAADCVVLDALAEPAP
ncbi:helix-turn-helix domain-containing protein [Mycobacterium fragae]|uniref:MerR family transcriptional regulator n=2 Tax=Mycobacterium fragae TaxID=1260918 RepID=A0A1X1V4K1_9MYCO|nr:helix-turn-helix domain-containing protein [Mycobacterium fragae]ORV64004.1 MerR family transcriptional regulator [Mycobacterium fragae]